jgi:site-specific DNA-methyltransferase (adenine-specific)
MREKIAGRTVDLIYLDPPFKSDLNYNVLFKADGIEADEAQMSRTGKKPNTPSYP